MAEPQLETDAQPIQPRTLEELQQNPATRPNQPVSNMQPGSDGLPAQNSPNEQSQHPLPDTPLNLSPHQELQHARSEGQGYSRTDTVEQPVGIVFLPQHFDFYELLLAIGDEITTETMEKIKFLYKGVLTVRMNEKIKNPRELFHCLQKLRVVVPECVIHLQKMVMMIENEETKAKLMKKLYNYSVKQNAIHYRHCTEEPVNGYRRFKCHIKGLEHDRFKSKHVENLMIAVASLTGLALEDIHVDGIELTNSIYITLMVPDEHYKMFVTLLQDGLPILSELKVDLITLEDEKEKTTVEVSSGRNIEQELPPIYESPEEKIQQLVNIVDDIEEENIKLHRQVENLQEKVTLLESDGTGSDKDERAHLPKKQTPKSDQADEDPTTKNAENENEEHLSDRLLNETLKRTDGLGYSKTIIRQIVTNCILHAENSVKKRFEAERNKLIGECRFLQENLEVTNSLLQQTAPAFGFKQSVMKQLEDIFDSEGNSISSVEGYREDVMQLAMDLSKEIKRDDQSKLESGYEDVPITLKVKKNRRMLLLRLFYLENLKCETLILIENFVSQKLAFISRDDLNTTWRGKVVPKAPSQLELLARVLQTTFIGKDMLLPEVVVLLRKTCSKLKDGEKKELREKLPNTPSLPDEDLLLQIIQTNFIEVQTNQGNLLQFLRALLGAVNRDDLYLEFERDLEQVPKALRQDLHDVLRHTSSKLTKKGKKSLRGQLKNRSKCRDDDDLLERLMFEQFLGFIITIDKLNEYVHKKLREIGEEAVYEEFLKRMTEIGIPLQPSQPIPDLGLIPKFQASELSRKPFEEPYLTHFFNQVLNPKQSYAQNPMSPDKREMHDLGHQGAFSAPKS